MLHLPKALQSRGLNRQLLQHFHHLAHVIRRCLVSLTMRLQGLAFKGCQGLVAVAPMLPRIFKARSKVNQKITSFKQFSIFSIFSLSLSKAFNLNLKDLFQPSASACKHVCHTILSMEAVGAPMSSDI